MIKNLISVLIFLFIFIFIAFIITIYNSDNHIKKINLNRINNYTKIDDILPSLPLLKNDTQDVIKFNSGYDNNSNRTKRSFWNLFIKND